MSEIFSFVSLVGRGSKRGCVSSSTTAKFCTFTGRRTTVVFLSSTTAVSMKDMARSLPVKFFTIPMDSGTSSTRIITYTASTVITGTGKRRLSRTLRILSCVKSNKS